VKFLGFVPDSLNVIAGLEVMVVPSYGETFSIATLEAMALGKPVVATRVGGIPEVLGEAGTLLEPGNPKLLADAIAVYLRDPQRAAEDGRKARERALAHFTRRQMLAEHVAYYERMLTSRPGGR